LSLGLLAWDKCSGVKSQSRRTRIPRRLKLAQRFSKSDRDNPSVHSHSRYNSYYFQGDTSFSRSRHILILEHPHTQIPSNLMTSFTSIPSYHVPPQDLTLQQLQLTTLSSTCNLCHYDKLGDPRTSSGSKTGAYLNCHTILSTSTRPSRTILPLRLPLDFPPAWNSPQSQL
jgi:hypothetical protein